MIAAVFVIHIYISVLYFRCEHIGLMKGKDSLWWNVTEYIYSSTIFRNLYFTYFNFLLVFTSTLLHLIDGLSYFTDYIIHQSPSRTFLNESILLANQ